MHFHVDAALVVVAVVSSIVLLLQGGERAVALVALAASGFEALRAFGLMSVSIAILRIDVVVPAVLAVAGTLAWLRAASKPAVTAGTLAGAVGAVQLLLALHVVR